MGCIVQYVSKGLRGFVEFAWVWGWDCGFEGWLDCGMKRGLGYMESGC